MNQAVVEFLKKISEDEDLQARMQNAADADEAYAIASGAQEGFTKEEFVEDMMNLRDAISGDEELSEDDLKALAGGKLSSGEVSVITTFSVVTGGAAVVGVAAAGAAF